MSTLTSRDGTTIVYDKVGTGAPVVLIDGAMGYRASHGSGDLAAALSKAFTAIIYDRRGRGESGDSQDYAVDREIEDIEALIDAAGGSAFLYGASSGGALALRAAGKLGASKVPKLAIYEPPFDVNPETAVEFSAYKQEIADLIAANDRSGAVARFLSDMMPPEMLDEMKRSPDWKRMEDAAPTLVYDNEIMGDGLVPRDAAFAATMPALVLDGDSTMDFLKAAADELAQAMPDARRKTLTGIDHAGSPDVIAPALIEFFRSK